MYACRPARRHSGWRRHGAGSGEGLAGYSDPEAGAVGAGQRYEGKHRTLRYNITTHCVQVALCRTISRPALAASPARRPHVR